MGVGSDEEDEELSCIEPNLLTVPYRQITRNNYGELHTVERQKRYRFAYNKGVIMDDFTVKPFGYQE